MDNTIDTLDDAMRHNASLNLPKAVSTDARTLQKTVVATLSARGTDASTESAIVGTPLPNPKHELFAQHVASGHSYKSAYELAYPGSPRVVRHAASALAHDISVRARVQALTRASAERASHSIAERLAQLADISAADPGELARVTVSPCSECHTDEALAAAYDDAAAANGPSPDPSQPRPSCKRCGGHGVSRVELTPTESLSGPARRLLKGVRQKASGEIEIVMHDQLAATRLLAELSGWLVTQNANINLNANAPLATPAPVSADDVLSAFHALRKVSNP